MVIKKLKLFLESLKIKYDINNLSLRKDNEDGSIYLYDKDELLTYINVELIQLTSLINNTCSYIIEFDYKKFIKQEGIKKDMYDKIFFLYIYDVKTYLKYRGKGYASILLEAVIKKSNFLNYPYILLKAFPNEKSNLNRLVNFYSKFGFKEVNNGDGGIYMVYKKP